MIPALNETHDPALTSWVESANGHPDFPIQNLPLGVFRRRGSQEPFRVGVAIGDHVLDLAAAGDVIGGEALAAARDSSLNGFMDRGPEAWSRLRHSLSQALRAGSPLAGKLALVPRSSAEHALPARIGDYTDFYTSIHHATNIGKLFRPDNPLLPNYKWVPIGYHGRASTINVSGHDFHRPRGQVLPPGPRPRCSARRSAWTTSSSWASTWAAATSREARSPSARPSATCSASRC
jgi:fumarylacetoacetase